MDTSVEEAELRKTMLSHCKKAILLCDDSKFGDSAFYKICGLDKIDCLISNATLPEQLSELTQKNEVRVLTP